MEGQAFDFIVVGSGAAGGVAAARISESGRHSVLLLETGGDDRSLVTRIPLGMGRIMERGTLLRKYDTEPDRQLNGRSIYWPRGRTLGGSAAVNGMVWVHGNPEEYDDWAAQGCLGWSHSDLLPYFKRVEAYSQGSLESRGRDGPVTITEFCPRDSLTDAFLDGCAQAGVVERVADYNEKCRGGGYVQYNTKNGSRCSVREAYIEPASRRTNLRIQLGGLARRVLFENRRAIGVEVSAGGRIGTVSVRREVILCAGTFSSPQLLELSGIGRRDVLEPLGIPVLHHLPGVGTNLSEHLFTPLAFEATQGVGWNAMLRSRPRTVAAIGKYLLTRNGPMTSITLTGHAFVPDSEGGTRGALKIQLQQISGSMARDGGRFKFDETEGFTIGTYLICPRSRGTSHIRTSDPEANPILISNHLTHEYDLAMSVRALQLARKTAESPSMSRLMSREIRPGKLVRSEGDLIEYVRATGSSAYHPVGTCRMGIGEGAVVDPKFKVHGLESLRVADASIMPSIASSNTNAICMVIGERVAEAVLSDV